MDLFTRTYKNEGFAIRTSWETKGTRSVMETSSNRLQGPWSNCELEVNRKLAGNACTYAHNPKM